MKKFRFAACLIAVLTVCVHGVAGQTNGLGAQSTAGVATNSGARAVNVRPNGPVSRNVARGAIGTNARTAYVRPTQTGVQRPLNSRSNYSASGRPLNRTLAAMNARQGARIYTAQPDADLLARNDVVQGTLPMTDQPIGKPDDLQPTRKIPAGEEITPRDLAPPGVQTDGKILERPSDAVPPGEMLQNKPRHKSHG